MCGEHVIIRHVEVPPVRFIPTCVGNIFNPNAFLLPVRGSSPRVWGTCRLSALMAMGLRFIPTCVGNMYIFCAPRSLLPVHPHVCGEHFIRRMVEANADGSSPRVWGTFRPARSFLKWRAVHPHVCGEHEFLFLFLVEYIGSSPRVWGTFPPQRLHGLDATVHPHVCGEHENKSTPEKIAGGSSPRVWGTCTFL